MTDPTPLPPLPPDNDTNVVSLLQKILAALTAIPATIRSPEGKQWAITIGVGLTLLTSVWNSCQSAKHTTQIDANTAKLDAVHSDVVATKDVQSKVIAVEVRGAPSDVAALKQVVTSNAVATQPAK